MGQLRKTDRDENGSRLKREEYEHGEEDNMLSEGRERKGLREKEE